MELPTPLHDAAHRGDLDKVKELVRYGADFGATDSRGWTPLMVAILDDKEDTAAYLAKKMTVQELSVVDEDGCNVLHRMAAWYRPWSHVIQDIADACPSLLQRENSDGHRPKDIARNRSQDVYNILVKCDDLQQRRQQQQQQQYTSGIADNVENPCNITIAVVGHHGVGKSCFVRQLKQEYIPEHGPGSTDTADVYVNFLGYNPNTGLRQKLDEEGEIKTSRQRLKHIIDQTDKTSPTTPQQHKDNPAAAISTMKASVSSAGEKTEESQIVEISHRNPSRSEELSGEQRRVMEEVMDTNMEDWNDFGLKGRITIYDFGGEKVFYNTQHCFMSSNMVFVLVFDVDMCLDPRRAKDGYEQIEFWLKVFATYAIDEAAQGKGTPPVILVGSYLDLVSSDKEKQEELFISVLEKLYEEPEIGEIIDAHVQGMFPVANLNDCNKNQHMYKEIWNKIIEIAKLQSQWEKPVPARWVALEYALVRLKIRGNVILTYDELLEINRKTSVPLAKPDIMNFLRRLRFSGSFLCFDLHSKKPFIVLQPQWIIDAFKAIITDPKFIADLSPKQTLQWKQYEKSGVLSLDLIRQLWGRYEKSKFLAEEDKLVIAMETLGLLTKPISVDAEVDYFIVPSILQTADPEIIRPVLDDPDTVTSVTICAKFDNPFIPQAIWDKMIASCIHRFQRLREFGHDGLTFIRRGFACLSVDCLWNMIINCSDNAMKVTMFKKDTDHSVPTGTGINLLSILEFLLKRILALNHQSHLGYQFYLHNDFRFTAEEKMVKKDDLQQAPRLQCYGSNGTRWIDRDDLSIWFGNPNQKTKRTLLRHVGKSIYFTSILEVSMIYGDEVVTYVYYVPC
ncbi:uncharacterized protein LOC110457988 [Mizuhopecten yessoensis]|uniref:uncharacterized protein LOC110457988 n=1 Tax=Mizuhopecten yessoensis TaxID=6573 RepID=UPI000B45CE7B|nr:uncharacterized protein LOC110457988 [Mizuhopecten yessoensis]